MNIKRLLLSIVLITVFISLFDFVVHGVLLSSAYGETKEVWRSESGMMSRMWLQYLCYFISSIGFVTIWALAFPNKGIKCGAIYGFLVGLISSAGMLINFVFLPIPNRFISPWLLSGMIVSILMGMLVSLLYHSKATDTNS